jgi:peptide/nickel transport system substrate-binding protein
MIALGLLIVASIVLAACAQPTPETITETVVETVVVTEVIETEGETVVETVVVTVEPEEPVEEPVEEGPRTLVICQGQEPDTLYIWGGSMLAASNVQHAIYDGPIDFQSFGYQPVILEKLPDIADGDAVINAVDVAAGDTVIDDTGEIAELAEGVMVRPAGCRSSECAVEYDGSALQMDQMQVTFKMLPDLLWSDGTPLTANDSVYSFQLYMDPDTPTPSRRVGERTSSYEAVDDLTTVWAGLPGYLDAEYYAIFSYIGSPLPEHQLGQYTAAEIVEAEEASRTPMGWGPYIIDEWVQGDNITLSKNPNYFRADEGLPKFDTVVYRMVGENSNANVAAILAGECDIVDQTSHLDDQSELLLELQGAGQLNATFVTGTVWEHADFQIRRAETNDGSFSGIDTDGDEMGPFGDVRLRQAVAMCMDRQAVVDTVMFGQSLVLHTYIPPQHPLFNADVTQWPFDVEAGSALLEEIGWLDDDGDPLTPRIASGVTGVPDGTPLSFSYGTTTATQRQQATQVMAESAAQCGIQMNLEYYPASEWFADGPEGPLFGRRFELGQFAWLTGVQPACDLYLTTQIPSEETGWAGQNDPGYSNLDYDAVCNAAIQSLPGEPAYDENHLAAQAIFADDLPVVPLYLRLKLAATRPDMCNFIMDPTENSEFFGIEEFDYGECAQ